MGGFFKSYKQMIVCIYFFVMFMISWNYITRLLWMRTWRSEMSNQRQALN